MAINQDDLKSNEIQELINLKRIISSKDPRMARLLPGFIYSYLNRIIHVNTINETVARNRALYGIDFVKEILSDFGLHITVTGIENIIPDKKYTIVSNHPLGGPDGLALIKAIGEYHRDLIFPANDLLLNLENIRPLFIPVNKHGLNSREMIKTIDTLYSSKSVIVNFPFGLVSRKRGGKIMDLDWKKSFITKSKLYQRVIVPTHISGRNSNFFYNLANLRRFLGIKMNFEMLYLPDEMFRQKNKNIHITFGKPISWEFFDSRHTDAEWAELLRLYVYKIADDPNAAFHPDLK